MNKLLLFFAVLVGVYFLRRKIFPGSTISGRGGFSRSKTDKMTEKIAECQHCGVLVPESEGVAIDQQFYCCSEHARLGKTS